MKVKMEFEFKVLVWYLQGIYVIYLQKYVDEQISIQSYKGEDVGGEDGMRENEKW